jgi:5,10-methylenetetrahydromethanopterin reductase
VPVEVAATGPRVIGVAARRADRVLLAVGADPERLRWGIECARSARAAAGVDPAGVRIGAFVNVACHRDPATARRLVSGGLTTFARFAVMDGTIPGRVSDEQRRVLEDLHRAYDMRRHTMVGSPQTHALTDDFIDRWAVVGPPERCIERLREIAALGVDKLIVIGPTAGADRDAARESAALMESEVLPAFA